MLSIGPIISQCVNKIGKNLLENVNVAIVTLKYIYPGIKRFFVRKCGHPAETTKLDPVFVNQLGASMREIVKLAEPHVKPAAVADSSV